MINGIFVLPWKGKTIFCLGLFFMTFYTQDSTVKAADESYDVIIEKNLFNSQRKKWVMEDSEQKKDEKKEKQTKKNVSKILLYGTVISDEMECAVIKEKKGRGTKRHNSVYMEGDYVNGYLVKDIEPRKVVLVDEDKKEAFEIFINEGEKQRTAGSNIKTAIKKERWERSVKQQEVKKRQPSKAKRKKAQTANFLKRRLQKDLKFLKQKTTKLRKKQAARDYEKIEKLIPFMTDKDRTEVFKIKKEIDKLLMP